MVFPLLLSKKAQVDVCLVEWCSIDGSQVLFHNVSLPCPFTVIIPVYGYTYPPHVHHLPYLSSSRPFTVSIIPTTVCSACPFNVHYLLYLSLPVRQPADFSPWSLQEYFGVHFVTEATCNVPAPLAAAGITDSFP